MAAAEVQSAAVDAAVCGDPGFLLRLTRAELAGALEAAAAGSRDEALRLHLVPACLTALGVEDESGGSAAPSLRPSQVTPVSRLRSCTTTPSRRRWMATRLTRLLRRSSQPL